MAIVLQSCFLPFPNSISLSPLKTITKELLRQPYSLPRSLINRKKDFQLSSVGSISFPIPEMDIEYSESEFQAQGVTFSRIGDGYVVKMALENGTSAKLMLPSGLITSFRAQMWHGGTMELLHTIVSENSVIQGGLSLALALENDIEGISWSPNHWSFQQLQGNPQESIQLHLISRNTESKIEVKNIITLHQDNLTSEVQVSNLSTYSLLNLTGSLISHMAVSTPDATYAIGLEGSDYYARPPLKTDFTIIPPDSTNKTQQDSTNFWAFNKLFSNLNARNGKKTDREEDSEGEEDENNKQLTEKLSRIYTSAPRILSIIDRGRRNSVNLRRDGFTELYVFSPGSEHEMYSRYSYIKIGHAALLEPIILNAQSEWRGGMKLLNPNT